MGDAVFRCSFSGVAFGGLRVDDVIEESLLGVVEPETIAAAVEAEPSMASQRDQVQEALLRDLQGARYAAVCDVERGDCCGVAV